MKSNSEVEQMQNTAGGQTFAEMNKCKYQIKI